uniref:TNFR-Cys domain-containing protein n=1 Tax=Timema douglasi TaxID=61478 RepID=A0A7R8VJU9_TIMDO|nr:unnamed protein product [Timema douglasi]
MILVVWVVCLPLATALCRSGRQFWDTTSESCVNCTRCISPEEVVLRPCEIHQDTLCGPISSLNIDWSWIDRSKHHQRRKHHQVAEDLDNDNEPLETNRKHHSHEESKVEFAFLSDDTGSGHRSHQKHHRHSPERTPSFPEDEHRDEKLRHNNLRHNGTKHVSDLIQEGTSQSERHHEEHKLHWTSMEASRLLSHAHLPVPSVEPDREVGDKYKQHNHHYLDSSEMSEFSSQSLQEDDPGEKNTKRKKHNHNKQHLSSAEDATTYSNTFSDELIFSGKGKKKHKNHSPENLHWSSVTEDERENYFRSLEGHDLDEMFTGETPASHDGNTGSRHHAHMKDERHNRSHHRNHTHRLNHAHHKHNHSRLHDKLTTPESASLLKVEPVAMATSMPRTAISVDEELANLRRLDEMVEEENNPFVESSKRNKFVHEGSDEFSRRKVAREMATGLKEEEGGLFPSKLSPEPFSAAESLVWDGQAVALAMAVFACLLFFVVAAIYSIHHARQWRRLKDNFEAGELGFYHLCQE